MNKWKTCPVCKGEGYWGNHPCCGCDGDGEVEVKEKSEEKILRKMPSR